MVWYDRLYRGIADALLSTTHAQAEDAARTAARRLAPIVWLTGKTGAGKTAIVSVLSGHPRAEVEKGFMPCTPTARVFDYPEDAPVIRFLETRGIESRRYKPAEDIAWAEGQPHLILAAMRVSDPGQQAVRSVLRTARKRHPDWPIVVAQTGLHDLYPPGMTHPDPDAFAEGATPDREALRAPHQALARQRGLFTRLRGAAPVFVPIDFTGTADGYSPPDYRSEALRGALAAAGLPVLAGFPTARQGAFENRLSAIVLSHAAMAAGGASIPLPFADMATFATMNGLMLRTLGQQYEVAWTSAAFSRFFSALGLESLLGWGLGFGLMEAVKLIPLLGSFAGDAINGALAFRMTAGFGQAACVWLDYQRRGEIAPQADIRAAFAKGIRQRPPKILPRKAAA